ncbi:PH domain-containing protein [Candidatus Woesearchaeota archaeon]|nr:PH domain-containing protein [Candidatus Woesearchaeota archaeon]MBT5397136.1 PH domain-containing protein [Candidatus Woesearchaeota archaeon]MBT5924474.1 PH domain-containing protein [Candidatus Woesearchaeota archaeon]MBT6367318.1 PH domain-containing protein [Candidatus Woesearchaeota archaeon]MBT7762536.1 PH domain-containing protein [Candidatus Woesearchaeota archaeon]
MRKKVKWMDDDRILYSFRKTRKAFLIEYVCGGLLIVLVLFSAIWITNFSNSIRFFVLGLGIVLLGYTEISRYMYRYKITNEKIIISHGLIKHNRKNVYFHPLGFVPDINIKQGHLQRILGYGTIDVEAGKGKTFEIKDIEDPHRIMKVIEELIQRHKKE